MKEAQTQHRQPSFLAQVRHLLGHGIQAELAEKERILSPVLFAITMLLLFSFSIGEIDASLVPQIFVAQTALTLLFALQTSFARILDADTHDRVFQLLKSYPLGHGAWYVGKYLLVIILGLTILVPTMLISAIMSSGPGLDFFNPMLFLIAFLALAGLASLGVLLSVMVLSASGKEVLFPVLYFPLSAPVLLAAVQSMLAYLGGDEANVPWHWLGLLGGFDIIYFTLGVLLFGELLESE